MADSQVPSDELLDLVAETQARVREVAEEGPSASQPIPQSFHRATRKIQRRFTGQRRFKSILQHEDRFPIALTNNDSVHFRTKVLDRIRVRLAIVGIDTSSMPDRFFAWMLPKNGASLDDWDTLMNTPVLLSNTLLRTMLKMIPSRSRTQSGAGTSVFYIRTFAFQLPELVDVLETMFDQGFGAQDAPYVLWELLQHANTSEANSQQTMFIRYCGTSSYSSPWTRHQQDLKEKYTNFKSLFFATTMMLYPEIIASAEIDALPDATIYGELDLSRQRSVNLREQALIALFGSLTLLNTAKGGLNSQFIPHEIDRIAVSDLGMSLLRSLSLYSVQNNTNLPLIRAYAQAVQDYAKANPASTNSHKHPITDDVKNLIYNSAVSASIRGYSIMVTIGSDMPPDTVKNLKPWYKGGFESGNLVIDIFNELARNESFSSSGLPASVSEMYTKRQLPFVDLYPWTKKDKASLPSALKLLRKYLQAVKPIIALTFSTLVSSSAVGIFHHARGIKYGQTTEHLGIPTLSKFDDEVKGRHDDNCCIVIPCIHPGSVRRSVARGEILIRLMYMTLAIAWLAMQEAIQISQDQQLSKREICQQVRTNVLDKTGPSSAFGQRFNSLKNDLREGYATTGRVISQRRKLGSVKNLPPVSKSAIAEKTHARRLDLAQTSERDQGHSGNALADEEIVGTEMARSEKLYRVSESERFGAAGGATSTLSYDEDHVVIQSPKSRWLRALDQLHMICECDMSEGSPWSPTRRAQVDRLIALSLGNLYGTKSGDSEEELQIWLMKAPESILYYFAANDIDEQIQGIPDLLSVFLTDGMDLETELWKDNMEECNRARNGATAWIIANSTKMESPFRRQPKLLLRSSHCSSERRIPNLRKRCAALTKNIKHLNFRPANFRTASKLSFDLQPLPLAAIFSH